MRDNHIGVIAVRGRWNTASSAAKFWEDPAADAKTGKPPYTGNKGYRLRDLLRASTAAPFYFSPKKLRIAEGEPEGLFVDGGVSAYNNPSLLLLMIAGIKGCGFKWPLGRDKLMMISIGAGWSRPAIPLAKSLRMPAAELAVKTLHSVIWDAHVKTLTMMQALRAAKTIADQFRNRHAQGRIDRGGHAGRARASLIPALRHCL